MRIKNMAGLVTLGLLIWAIHTDPVATADVFDAILCKLGDAAKQVMRFVHSLAS